MASLLPMNPPLADFALVSSKIGMLDVPSLVKLTRELYTQCNLFAKDTPNGFQELLPELGLLQWNLRVLGDNIKAPIHLLLRASTTIGESNSINASAPAFRRYMNPKSCCIDIRS